MKVQLAALLHRPGFLCGLTRTGHCQRRRRSRPRFAPEPQVVQPRTACTTISCPKRRVAQQARKSRLLRSRRCSGDPRRRLQVGTSLTTRTAGDLDGQLAAGLETTGENPGQGRGPPSSPGIDACAGRRRPVRAPSRVRQNRPRGPRRPRPEHRSPNGRLDQVGLEHQADHQISGIPPLARGTQTDQARSSRRRRRRRRRRFAAAAAASAEPVRIIADHVAPAGMDDVDVVRQVLGIRSSTRGRCECGRNNDPEALVRVARQHVVGEGVAAHEGSRIVRARPHHRDPARSRPPRPEQGQCGARRPAARRSARRAHGPGHGGTARRGRRPWRRPPSPPGSSRGRADPGRPSVAGGRRTARSTKASSSSPRRTRSASSAAETRRCRAARRRSRRPGPEPPHRRSRRRPGASSPGTAPPSSRRPRCR